MKVYLTLICISLLFIVRCPSAPVEDESAGNETNKCTKTCVTDNNPVCGYNSNCYKLYSNQCTYDKDKCIARHNLETVDTSLCELAEKDSHPNFKLCSE